MANELFWIGHVGIALELIGAGLGVWFAWRSKQIWDQVITVNGQLVFRHEAPNPVSEAIENFARQAWAFGLLGAGLVLELMGDFASF